LTLETAVALSSRGLAVTNLVMCLEYGLAFRRKAFAEGTLFDWAVYRLHSFGLLPIVGGIGSPWVFEFATLVRALAAVALIVSPLSTIALAALFILSVMANLRHQHGRDGADEMALVLCVGLLGYSVLHRDEGLGPLLGPYFITAQVCLCYLISGIAKITSPEWVNGSAVRYIFGTKVYGTPQLTKLVGARIPGLILCWPVIGWETLFPLSLLTPQTAAVFLVLGVMFHLGTACIMGLNSFLLVFLSTYPIVFWVTR
jgi:hypothetical protein